jgi:hypothetical protein
MKNQTISYYPQGVFLKKGIDNPPTKYLSFLEFIKLHTCKELKKQADFIKTLEYGSWEYKNAKKRLPCVLLNKFSYNLTEGFLQETPYKPFDVDLKDNCKETIAKFKQEIKKIACLVVDSPSGGLKFFIKTNFNTSNNKEYRYKYDSIVEYLERKYDIILDKMQGNIKQPYFISYNETLEFNNVNFYTN